MYFSFAKKKLELSRKRKPSGSKGGATMRIKVTDEEISKATEKKNQYVSFDDFMAENPKIKNDLYTSRMHLLDGVNWMKLDTELFPLRRRIFIGTSKKTAVALGIK